MDIVCNTRLRVNISGRVQGVCYRIETKRKADSLGVKGWVKNSINGNVEAIFEGDESAVRTLLEWCENGPPLAIVDRIDSDTETFHGSELSFEIKY